MLFDKGEVDISTLPVFVLANLAAGMHSVIPDVNLLNPSEVNGLKILEDVKNIKQLVLVEVQYWSIRYLNIYQIIVK
jgi:hypothetical protein